MSSRHGFVTGLMFEAEILRSAGHRTVSCRGPGPVMAEAAARELVAEGCTALISFGVAGALAPSLKNADPFIASMVVDESARHYSLHAEWSHRLMADAPDGVSVERKLISVSQPVITGDHKRQLHRETGADAVDMESAAVASIAERHGLPFIALRVIMDDSETTIPPAALAGMRLDGSIDAWATIRALSRRPQDLPALVRLAGFDARAKKALARLAHLARGL